jgi:DNA-binding transcriptional ArsR family regulator
MTPELLHHPDPAQLSSITSTAEILAAVRQLGADDDWSPRALQTLDHLLVVWTASTAARPDDVEGIAELQQLIDYVRHRSANRQHLPPPARTAGRRSTTCSNPAGTPLRPPAGPNPGTRPRPGHPRPDRHGHHPTELTARLQGRDISISSGRLSQLLSLMEAHGLIDRRREGRENRLSLTPAGQQAPAPAPATKPLRSKLAA